MRRSARARDEPDVPTAPPPPTPAMLVSYGEEDIPADRSASSAAFRDGIRSLSRARRDGLASGSYMTGASFGGTYRPPVSCSRSAAAPRGAASASAAGFGRKAKGSAR